MYILHPFAVDEAWNSVPRMLKLRNEAVDEFSIRKLTLALGRADPEGHVSRARGYLRT
jgi:hypothetical protein